MCKFHRNDVVYHQVKQIKGRVLGFYQELDNSWWIVVLVGEMRFIWPESQSFKVPQVGG